MIGLARGILQSSQDIFFLKERIVSKDFLLRSSCSQEIKDVRDTHAQAADTRTSTALACLNRDSLQSFEAHYPKV